MLFSKKCAVVFFTTLFACTVISLPVSAISETRAGAISMTCNSIKFTLKELQKTDSKMRVNLGSNFEHILTNFMTSLNLRLVKNSEATADLTDLQATFSSERDFFNRIFIEYSKTLEELIAYDCKNDPYGFYSRLEITRSRREEVRSSYLRLRDITREHRIAVEALKGVL